jgi:hypothetical protein
LERERESSVQADSKPIWQRKGAGAIVLIFRRIPPKSRVQELEPSSEVLFFLLFFALFFKKSPQCFPLFFFPSKSTVCGGGHANEVGRERKKKEVGRGERNDEFF